MAVALKLEEIEAKWPSNDDPLARNTREELARVLVTLRQTRPGTPQYGRLTEAAAALETQIRREAPPDESEEDLSDLSDADLLARINNVQARILDAKRRIEDIVATSTPPDDEAPPLTPTEPAEQREKLEQLALLDAPAPEPPKCDFCHQPFADCDVMKSTRLDLWRVLHSLHPDEVRRRSEEATAVMLHQIGKPSPWS